MLPAPYPDDEPRRLETLRSLQLLDTSPEERFDRLTRLARRLFGVPIALVSLVDANRQWFKSCVGLPASETARDISFCGHAIMGDEIFLVPNALADARFADNPLVLGDPHIRFYAGCPLKVPNGSRLGTLCVIDVQPRDLGPEDLALLRDLARMAEQEIAAVQLATMDELTMLSNRRGFEALAQHSLSVCKRLERPATLLYIDLDGFKAINDTYGHAEGDRALVGFAAALRATMREADVVGRLGGDEFVALLTNADASQSMVLQQRLDDAVQALNQREQRGYQVAYSVGAVTFDPSRHGDVAALLADSDGAMYQRKQARKVALREAVAVG